MPRDSTDTTKAVKSIKLLADKNGICRLPVQSGSEDGDSGRLHWPQLRAPRRVWHAQAEAFSQGHAHIYSAAQLV